MLSGQTGGPELPATEVFLGKRYSDTRSQRIQHKHVRTEFESLALVR